MAFWNNHARIRHLTPIGSADLDMNSNRPMWDLGGYGFASDPMGYCKIFRQVQNRYFVTGTATALAQGLLAAKVNSSGSVVNLTNGAAAGSTIKATLSAQTITNAKEHVGSLVTAITNNSAINGEWSLIANHDVANPNVIYLDQDFPFAAAIPASDVLQARGTFNVALAVTAKTKLYMLAGLVIGAYGIDPGNYGVVQTAGPAVAQVAATLPAVWDFLQNSTAGKLIKYNATDAVDTIAARALGTAGTGATKSLVHLQIDFGPNSNAASA